MTEYKCGHKSEGLLILDCNEMSLSAWMEWAESVGFFGTKEKCWDCWCKKIEGEKEPDLIYGSEEERREIMSENE